MLRMRLRPVNKFNAFTFVSLHVYLILILRSIRGLHHVFIYFRPVINNVLEPVVVKIQVVVTNIVSLNKNGLVVHATNIVVWCIFFIILFFYSFFPYGRFDLNILFSKQKGQNGINQNLSPGIK